VTLDFTFICKQLLLCSNNTIYKVYPTFELNALNTLAKNELQKRATYGVW